MQGLSIHRMEMVDANVMASFCDLRNAWCNSISVCDDDIRQIEIQESVNTMQERGSDFYEQVSNYELSRKSETSEQQEHRILWKAVNFVKHYGRRK